MQLVRTTLRLRENLKRAAQKLAAEEAISLQEVFNRALENYLENEGEKAAQKIIFKTHNLGKPLDNLRRADFYPKP